MRRGASNGSSGATDVPWARLGRRLGDQRSGSTGVASVPTTGSRHRTPGIETGCTGHATCMERPRKAFAIDLRGGSGLRPHCGGRHMERRQAAGASRLQSEPPLADRSLKPDEQQGLQARLEELQLPHRRCRMCANDQPVRQPVTSSAAALQIRAPFPRGPRAIHTPPKPTPCVSFRLCAPSGRTGTAQDIAGLTIFLCSRAGEYVIGQTIACDGGEVAAS